MKINYDYYKGTDLYCDGDVEKNILEYIDENKKNGYEKTFEKDISWPVFYHLSQVRQNILNWYPFKKESSVLEIGAGMGAITEVLCEKVQRVVAVELSKQRASAIAKRNQGRENLEIIVGNLNDIKFEEKFDYITLIGVFEYAIAFTEGEEPYLTFLNNIKKLLKPDGKILIAIENKFGLKYFLGAAEDHTGRLFDSITGYKNINNVKTFGKQELTSLLEKADLKYNNFYYPLPDYKFPNVIFSDLELPKIENINTYLPYYYENTKILFDEIEAYKEIIKEEEEKFTFFANSFFVEASAEKIEQTVKTVVFDSYNKRECRNIEINNIDINSKLISNINFESDKIDNVCFEKFWNRKYYNMLDVVNESNNKNEEILKLNNEILNLKLNIEGIQASRTYRIMKPFSKIYKNIFKKQ